MNAFKTILTTLLMCLATIMSFGQVFEKTSNFNKNDTVYIAQGLISSTLNLGVIVDNIGDGWYRVELIDYDKALKFHTLHQSTLFPKKEINVDETKQPDEIEQIRLCLEYHGKQKMDGLTVGLIGITITSLGGIISSNSNNNVGFRTNVIAKNGASVLSVIGGTTLLIGSIITIDANKWLRKKKTIPPNIR